MAAAPAPATNSAGDFGNYKKQFDEFLKNLKPK